MEGVDLFGVWNYVADICEMPAEIIDSKTISTRGGTG